MEISRLKLCVSSSCSNRQRIYLSFLHGFLMTFRDPPAGPAVHLTGLSLTLTLRVTLSRAQKQKQSGHSNQSACTTVCVYGGSTRAHYHTHLTSTHAVQPDSGGVARI